MSTCQYEDALGERLGFELLVAELSARFVTVSSADTDDAINEAFRRIVEFFQLDGCGLLAFRPDPVWVRVTHGFAADGFPPVPADLNLAQAFPWTHERVFVQGETTAVARLEDLPPEAELDRRTWLARGIRSSLQIPVPSAAGIHHSISMSMFREEREWPVEYIARMRLLGEVFVNALQRKRAEDELRRDEALLSDVILSAELGVWKLTVQTSTFWGNARAFELHDIPYSPALELECWLQKLHEEDRERVRAEIQQTLDSKGSFRSEFRVPLPDGRVRWLASRGRFHHGDGILPERMTGILLDITARKEAELAQRAAQEETERLNERLELENVHLRQQVRNDSYHSAIVGKSRVLRKVLHQIDQVGPTNAAVLIEGETGTGKELIARAIHASSSRRDRPMVCLNCGAIPVSLIESELFGREKGAYTGALARQIGRFELADGSTLLLDEVAELPLELQVKLLRVLQERTIERLGNPKSITVDVRVIAATNRDLQTAVREGRFREDLYYRLSVFPIRVPPLRERREDIPLLAWAFVEEFNRAMGKSVDSIARASIEAMLRHPWHGNVRELRNVVERAMIVTSGPCLWLEFPEAGPEAGTSSLRMEDVERDHICSVLKMTNGRVRGINGAAELLGLNPSTLASRMIKLGIQREIP